MSDLVERIDEMNGRMFNGRPSNGRKVDTGEAIDALNDKFEDMSFIMDVVANEAYVPSKLKSKLNKMRRELENIRAEIVKEMGE